MLCEKQIQTKSDVFETTNELAQKANFAFSEIIGSLTANEISPNLGRWSPEQKKEQFLTIDRF